jgi:hypothetical protein
MLLILVSRCRLRGQWLSQVRITQPWQTRPRGQLSQGTGFIYYSGKEEQIELRQKFTANGDRTSCRVQTDAVSNFAGL